MVKVKGHPVVDIDHVCYCCLPVITLRLSPTLLIAGNFSGYFFMMKVRKRNSILAHASPRIKRRALVGAGVMPTFEKLTNNSIRDGYNPRQVHCCSSGRCGLCPKLNTGSTFKSSLTGREYLVICNSHLSCDSKHVVYLISCRKCGFQYVGETSQLLRCRINQHRSSIRKSNPSTLVAKHFASPGHTVDDIRVMPIERIEPHPNETQRSIDSRRRTREDFWIRELGTLDPYGLNDKLQSFGTISQRQQGSLHVTYAFFNKHPHRRHTKRNYKKAQSRRRSRNFDPAAFLGTIKSTGDHLGFLHSTRTLIMGLTKRNIGALDLYLASDPGSSLTPCLLKIVKDLVNFRLGLGMSHIDTKEQSDQKSRVFLQVLYDNKGMDKIGISKILRSKEVISTVPQNFPDKVPLVCYRYTPTVSSKLLNFREESQAVGKASASLSCDCHSSRFNYSPLGHVITGDLNIVSNPKLRDIFRKGPKYRLPRKIDWSLNYDLIRKGVLDCQTKWAKKNHVPQTVLDEWVNAVLSKVKSKATKLSQGFGFPEPQSIFNDKGVKKCLQNLHERFVPFFDGV